jgi:hypothetical protein
MFHAVILTGIISKGTAKFELKFFKVDSFLNLFEFLTSHRKPIKL